MSINAFQNTQTAADWVTDTGLELLLNGLHAAPYFNTDFTENFEKDFAVGDTIVVPLPQQYISQRNNLTYNPQPLSRPSTTIVCQQTSTIPFEWDPVEKALQMERGDERARELYVKPAIGYMRQDVDSDLVKFAYQNTNMITGGSLGTDPTTFDATSATVLQKLSQMGCPIEDVDIGLLLPPSVMRAVKASTILAFNPQTDLTKQFRAGTVGKADGMEWYRSNSLIQHTAGTWAGAVTVTSFTGNQLVLACTTGDTFKAGDKIALANVNQINLLSRQVTSGTSTTGTMTFTNTADATGAASTVTLTVYPPIAGPGSQYQNVDALPVVGAAATLWPGTNSPSGKSGKVGIGLYRDAFMLVGVRLALPSARGVEIASVTQDPDSGLAINFVRQWDNVNYRWTNRLDMLWGRGVGLAQQCAVCVPCG